MHVDNPSSLRSADETSAEHGTKDLYHDGVIVLDIGGNAESSGRSSLKLAKDGHVRMLLM